MNPSHGQYRVPMVWVVVCAAVLSAFTVYYQISMMSPQGGLAWYEKVQWERTVQVMHGQQGTPWQYRLFTDSIVYGTVKTFEWADIPRPIGTAFVLIRFMQNCLMFCVAVIYGCSLGRTRMEMLFGISLLAGGMCHGLYDTDMTFNTYSDMILFLLAGWLIVHRRFPALLPLMLVAALNRETSGCIPFMLLFSQWDWKRRGYAPKKVWILFALCLAIWVIIVGGMRLPFIFGMRPYIVPTAGAKPILPLLWFNVSWWRTWVFLFATLGLIPVFALIFWKEWPRPLQRFFWAVAPVWFPLHFCLAHAPETRLFLVPQALLFIPGAMCAVAAARKNHGLFPERANENHGPNRPSF